MKSIFRKTIWRTIKAAWIAILALAMLSCTNGVGEATAIKPKGRLSVTASNTAEDFRTILAETYDLGEMSYALECVPEPKNTDSTKGDEKDMEAEPDTTKFSWENYIVMVADENILLDTGNWILTLTVKKGESVLYRATETKNITPGDNPISFTLIETADGNGSADVTVTFPKDAKVEIVKAGLLSLEWEETENFPIKEIDFDESNVENMATYTKSGIPNGNYILVFKFYKANGHEIAPGYSEIIKIRAGRTSGKIINIESLEKLHSITYRNIGSEDNINGVQFTDRGKTTFNEQETITLPTEITRTGYTFEGWFEKNAENEVKKIPVGTTEDKTFWAEWNPISYSITYNLNGGTHSAEKPENYTIESKEITLEAPTKIGYTFEGWFEKADFSGTTVTIIANGSTGDKTFYAKWSASTNTKYTVEHLKQNLNDNDYTKVYTDTEEKTGTTETNTEAQAKNYEGFSAQLVTQAKIAADGSTVVQIKYDRNSYTLTFNADGGNWDGNTENKTTSGKYGESMTVPAAPTRTGYTFTKWDKTVPNTFPAENTTYTAEWTANTYTVRFNANGGSGTMEDQKFTYDVEQVLIANGFTKTGYEFAGWSTEYYGEKMYGDQKAVKNITETNDVIVTLYAIWIPTVTVTATIVKSDIKVEKSENNFAVYFYADYGYDKYSWYVDGVQQSETSLSYNFYTSGKKPGIYSVVVIAVNDGIPYSTQINVKVE